MDDEHSAKPAASDQGLISAILAAAVFAFGLILFLVLGRQMANASGRVAQLEERINALVPSESASYPLLSWETANQHHSFVGYLSLGIIPPRRPDKPTATTR